MATKTDRRLGDWQEYEYRSAVHGGTGWYWQRADGLRMSMRVSGQYYPVGVGPRRGRPPRTRPGEDVPGGIPDGGWGGPEDPVDLSEHVLADMQTRHRGEHVRFVYKDVLMGTVGRPDYPDDWKGTGGLKVSEIFKYADEMWPPGTGRDWPTLGVPAELS